MTGQRRRGRYSLLPSDRDEAQMARAQQVVARHLSPSSHSRDHHAAATTMTAATATASPYRLSPSDSSVAAQKEHDAARWRSDLLHCEADLRELVTRGATAPPSLARIVRVLQLYDSVCCIAAGHSHSLAELLRLFRGEFCHAIFVDARNDGDEGDDDDKDKHGCSSSNNRNDDATSLTSLQHMPTYFDQVGSLLRETALLTAQHAQADARDAMDELRRQLARSNEAVTMYESEVGRLTRQHDNTAEQLRRAREELATYRAQSERAREAVERELRARNVEHKDMQLQLFRLRKQVAGGKAKLLKDSYRQLKRSKMQLMTTLFDEGDERVALLVLLSQLESRLNESLDAYDNEFVLTSDAAHGELRRKLCDTVAVLLEEMHLCEAQYRRLARRGGGDNRRGRRHVHAGASASTTRTSDKSVALSASTGGGGDGAHDGDGSDAVLDETDGFVVAMFDRRIYERLRVRAALRPTWLQQQQQQQEQQAESTAMTYVSSSSSGGGGDATSTTPAAASAAAASPLITASSNNMATTAGAPAGLTYEQRQRVWVERVFDAAVRGDVTTSKHVDDHDGSATTPRTAAAVAASSTTAMRAACAGVSADALLPRLLMHPMRDLDSARFCAGVDVYSGGDAMQQPQYVGSVRYLDAATAAVPVPEATRYVKVKPMSSIVGDARRTRIRGQPSHRSSHDDYHDDNDDVRDKDDDYTNNNNNKRHDSDGHYAAATRTTTTSVRHKTNHTTTATATTAAVAAGRQLRDWGAPPPATVAMRSGGVVAGDRRVRRVPAATTTSAARSANNNNNDDHDGLVSSSDSNDDDDDDSEGDDDGGDDTNVDGTSAGTPSAQKRTQSPSSQQQQRRRRGRGRGVFCAHPQLRAFDELGKAALLHDSGNAPTPQPRSRVAATSSTTAATVALQRLDPASPNRGPEWALYKALFGRHRSLAPRMLEVTTIDHVLRAACARHFARMEHRYAQCASNARPRSTNSVMARALAERFFRDAYELSDFQEALVDELEARYGLPELVAKNLYEMLCYLDAMASKDALLHVYLSVVRGFAPATHIHYICHMLYLLSHSWPSADPTSEVARDDALTVLRFLYRDAEAIVHVDVHAVMKDFDMASRAAPLTLVTMRECLSAAMLHQEEPVLLYLNGLFSTQCACESVAKVTYDSYATVVHKYWHEKNDGSGSSREDAGLVRYLATGLGLNRGALLSTKDLAYVAASMWCSGLWH